MLRRRRRDRFVTAHPKLLSIAVLEETPDNVFPSLQIVGLGRGAQSQEPDRRGELANEAPAMDANREMKPDLHPLADRKLAVDVSANPFAYVVAGIHLHFTFPRARRSPPRGADVRDATALLR
jgi:hypothetical protein